ncbi:MAG: hypothetical protein OEZ34_17350, partial [Spirochaetia bacterium]|nr:hypothetical protein [Spirochaetia bacterium]
MPGKSIPYSKGFSLHYENSIVPFTEHCLEDPERSFSELKKHKIEEIFFIPEMRGISSEKLSGAAALLKEKGIKCTVIENKTITENNFDFFRKTGKYLNAKLKSTSVLILYEKSNADDAESFIASLLIASKNSEISPEQAVYIATRKDFTPIQNRRVRQFKKHLENQQEKEASAEAGSGNQKHELKDSLSIIKSGFSIRMKLLTLASLIAGGSMLTLILSVTFLFKEHSERMVQEYNLSLARISGLKIASELERIENNSKHFAASIEKKNKNNRTQNTADEFFKINNEVISIGSISSLPNNRIKIRHYQKNTELSKQLGISDANIEKSLYNLQNAIIQSESGGPGYENASSSFNLPVLALIL